jgi:anti-sigma B factor antagonist
VGRSVAWKSPKEANEIQDNGLALVHIALPGEWDLARRSELTELLARAQQADQVRLDFSETAYMDASSLGYLIRLKNDLVQRGKNDIRLTGVNDNLKRLFEITGLDRVFTIESMAEPRN